MAEQFGKIINDNAPPLSAINPYSIRGEITHDQPVKSREESLSDMLKYTIPGVATGFVDTMGTSLGLTDEGDTQKFVSQMWPELGDFYSRGKVPLQTGGDLTGMLIPGEAMLQLYKGAGRAASLIRGGRELKALDAIFLRTGKYEKLRSRIEAYDRYLATKTFEYAPVVDTARKSLVRQAAWTRATNIIKENVAFELGVYATMNDSQTLYPDEFTAGELLAMNAAFPATFAGAAFARTLRDLRSSILAAAPELETARRGLGVLDPTTPSTPTNRAQNITVTAFSRNAVEGARQTFAKDIAKAPSDSALQMAQDRDKNLSKMVLAYDAELKNDIGKLFRDNTVSAATKVKSATNAEINTVVAAVHADEFTTYGAVSLEGMPTTREGLDEILTRIDKPITRIRGDIEKLEKQLKEIPSTPTPVANEKADELVTQINAKRAELDELQTLQHYIIEPDGAVVPANLRKPIFQDREGFLSKPNIQVDRATTLENKTYKAYTSADPLFGTPKHLIGMTDDFNLIIPPKETTIAGINVAKINALTGNFDLHSPEFYRHSMDDMAQDWGVFTPTKGSDPIRNRGYEIYKNLPAEIQTEIVRWSSSSQASKLRAWNDEGDVRFTQLYEAFEPMRKRIAEIADADGTVPVFRGESVASFNNPKSDLVSVTTSPDIAKHFERGSLTIYRVPVEDFVMPVSGKTKHFEHEFIVKGNKRRLNIGTPANVNTWEAQTLGERSVAFALAQRTVKDWTPGTKINLSRGDNWLKYDALIDLYKKEGDRIWQDVTLPSGIDKLDDLIYISLSKKYKEYTRLRALAENRGVLNLSDKQILNREDIRKMLNLPGTGSDRAHPIYNLFEMLHLSRETDLQKALGSTTEILDRAAQEYAHFPRMEAYAKYGKAEDMQGGMLNYPEDRAPVVMMKRPTDDASYSRQYLQEAMTVDRTRVLDEFAKARSQGAEVVADLFDTLVEDAARLDAARDLSYLVEGTQRGGTTVFQKSYAIGDNPTLGTMHQINLLTDKKLYKAAEKIFAQHHSVYQAIKNPKNEAALTNTLLYVHARRMGWDLGKKETLVELGDGLTGFKLEPNKRNRDRWFKLFGEEMPDDALMPTVGTPFKTQTNTFEMRPLALQPEAVAAAMAFDDVDQLILRNKNHLARIMGRPEIKSRSFHVPPLKFAGKEVVFLFDDAMNFIAPIAARTESEAIALAEKEIGARGGHGKWLNTVDMAKYHDVQLDEAFGKMSDYADPLLQTGPISGRQVGWTPNISVNAFDDLINTERQQIISLARQTREIFFAPQIQQARMRLQTATPASAKTGKSVWQMYVAEITGNPELNPEQMIGKIYNTTESLYNKSLQAAFDKIASVYSDIAGQRIKANRAESRIYAKMQDDLGPYNPFSDALDFAESTAKVKAPIDMRKDMAALNSLTSLLTLRLLGSGHEYLTMFSLPATMPAVIAGMKMTAHEKGLGAEGLKLWKARTAAWGSPVTDDVAMWNPTKAMMNGIHLMFSKEGREVWREASAEGFMDQAVSELFKTLTAPTEGYIKGLLRDKLKFTTYMADQSEVLARGISFMTGYKMAADVMQLESKRARFAFANRFANETIGDYAPHNRPRMFQGGPGMPLGLFMTFMWNYFQRIFGYVENSQNRALITQYATQGAVFGAQTVPGFQLYVDQFFSNWDGSANPVDAMNNRFGTEFTEWFLYGTVSNLPKMFGLEDGVAMYSRGDVNPRSIPTLLTLENTPVYSMFRDFSSAVVKGFQSVRNRGGFDSEQMAEIVQQYSTNRFLRNFATLFTGYVTDRQGQVIATSPTFKDILNGEVENEIALVARLVGMRGLNEALAANAATRNRNTDMSRRYRNEQINDVVRSELRKGKPEAAVIEKAITDHIRYGGSIDNVPNWLFEQMLRSRTDKTSLNVIKFFGNPQKSEQLLRLLHVLQQAPPSEIPTPLQ